MRKVIVFLLLLLVTTLASAATQTHLEIDLVERPAPRTYVVTSLDLQPDGSMAATLAIDGVSRQVVATLHNLHVPSAASTSVCERAMAEQYGAVLRGWLASAGSGDDKPRVYWDEATDSYQFELPANGEHGRSLRELIIDAGLAREPVGPLCAVPVPWCADE